MARQPQAIDYTSGTVSNSAVTLFEMCSALCSSAPTGDPRSKKPKKRGKKKRRRLGGRRR